MSACMHELKDEEIWNLKIWGIYILIFLNYELEIEYYLCILKFSLKFNFYSAHFRMATGINLEGNI